MVNLFLTSLAGKAGKTMFSAGLSQYWSGRGLKVGYLSRSTAFEDRSLGPDTDSLFMQKVLEPVGQDLDHKDIVIHEGCLHDFSAFIAEYPEGQVLVIHDYDDDLLTAVAEYQKIGSPLLGVIVNKVPRKSPETLRNKFAVALGMAGITLLGMVPEDRVLMCPSVSDLAEAIQGQIVNSPDNASDLVENLMMGSSTFDRGAAYYNRKNNKAVLLWGERPGYRKAALAGLQLAALQTSTRCIMISANAAPAPAAIQKADELKVSIISAPGALLEIEAGIEKAMLNSKFTQEKKLPRLQEILGSHLNFQQLNNGLGFLSETSAVI